MRRLTVISIVALFVAAGTASAAGRAHHATIRLTPGTFPNDAVSAFGSVWVASHRGYGISRIDPRTQRVHYFNLPTNQCYHLAPGGGRLWFSNCSGETPTPRIYAIDPRKGTIVAHTGGEGVEFGDGSVWTVRLVALKYVLYRLDPKTLVTLARIPLTFAPDPNGQAPGSFGLGSLWVSNSADQVIRIDPATNSVAAVITLPGAVASADGGYFGTARIGFAGGKAWVPSGQALYSIDPATNTAKRVLAMSPFSQQGDAVAVGVGNRVFVRTNDLTVAELDASSGTVVRRFEASITGGGGGLAVTKGSLWIVNAGDDSVWGYARTS